MNKAEAIKKLKWAVELLKVAKCPDCDGRGWIKVSRSKEFPLGSKQCMWCYGRYRFLKENNG